MAIRPPQTPDNQGSKWRADSVVDNTYLERLKAQQEAQQAAQNAVTNPALNTTVGGGGSIIKPPPTPEETGGSGSLGIVGGTDAVVGNTGTAGTGATGGTGGTGDADNAYLAKLAQLLSQKEKQLADAYAKSKANLDLARNDALRNSYVAYMRGLKAMPQVSEASGNGGYSQSLATQQQINYENNRNNIENTYLAQLRELEADRAAGDVELQNDYVTQLAALYNGGKARSTGGGTGGTTGTVATGERTYKMGNRVMTQAELAQYFKDKGWSAAEVDRYMTTHNLY